MIGEWVKTGTGLIVPESVTRRVKDTIRFYKSSGCNSFI